jgi:glycogen debranching enzyme
MLTDERMAQLKQRAEAVLRANDTGLYVKPAPGTYPHQWLWDSCFSAIGLAHVEPERAAEELTSLLRGQWPGGMMPHMIYASHGIHKWEALLWNTAKLSPRGVRTSGITQPPVLAIATEIVAMALSEEPRKRFLDQMIPALQQYHQWLYNERDPNQTGLVALVHPWESGMDDSPVWSEAMADLPTVAWWRRRLYEAPNVDRNERAKPEVVGRMVHLADILKAARYDSHELLRTSPVIIHDLAFNCILAAANESLERLAALSGQGLPFSLSQRFADTRAALETLWRPETGEYYSHQLPLGGLITIPTISMFMPLFAGTASRDRAELLRGHIANVNRFKTNYPVPTVPMNHPLFEPRRYWRGPVWLSTNWFVIRGLQRYGYNEDAERLRQRTLEMVESQGFREYYNPQTGEGLGAREFSWTAALVLDLLSK